MNDEVGEWQDWVGESLKYKILAFAIVITNKPQPMLPPTRKLNQLMIWLSYLKGGDIAEVSAVCIFHRYFVTSQLNQVHVHNSLRIDLHIDRTIGI